MFKYRFNRINERNKKKFNLFNEFLGKMNFKFEISQRYLNEDIEDEKEDVKLVEVSIK